MGKLVGLSVGKLEDLSVGKLVDLSVGKLEGLTRVERELEASWQDLLKQK